jgi:hypothetical protein
MQANRIGRIVCLGLSRCHCQDRRERQNRQSRNAHCSRPKSPSHLRPPLRPQPDFPIASRQAPLFPVNSRLRALGRARVVGHMHQHRRGAMQIEHRAAGTFHEAAARLARSMAGRLQALAGVCIFPFGPISLIAPCLKISPRCGSTRTPAMRARNPRGLLRRSRWCQTDVRLDASLDRNRSSIPTDRYRADCRRARQSSRHEHRRNT